MIVLLNLLLATLGLGSALAAFGGDAWRKGNARLIERITPRGWVSLSCLALTFVVGAVQEIYEHHQDAQAVEAKLIADRRYETLMKDLSAQVGRLQTAGTHAGQVGVPVQPMPTAISSPKALVQEAMNFAVSVSLSAEEQFTLGNWNLALDRFLQADSIANVAPIKARIADTYVRLGDYENALKFELEAVELAPDWNGPPYILAFSLLRLGRATEALPHAQRSCDLGFAGACDLIPEIAAATSLAHE